MTPPLTFEERTRLGCYRTEVEELRAEVERLTTLTKSQAETIRVYSLRISRLENRPFTEVLEQAEALVSSTS